MKTRTLIVVSCILWAGGLFYAGKETAALIAMVAHGVIWHLHRIEVKINRLLADRAITVSDSDLAE